MKRDTHGSGIDRDAWRTAWADAPRHIERARRKRAAAMATAVRTVLARTAERLKRSVAVARTRATGTPPA
jgi:hypothetical protein